MQEISKDDLTKPFFTVVIPVYNKGPHIHRSISSVLDQSFKNFELLLVNDASTDNSLSEIQKFEDSRIRLLHRTKPGPGGYAARNLGIEKAFGVWVAFLDADDKWYPNHLEKMYEIAQKNLDIRFISCGWMVSNFEKTMASKFYKKYFSNSMVLDLNSYLVNIINENNPIWTSVVCVNKMAISDKYFFPSNTDAKRGGDSYAWLKLLCKGEKIYWSNHLGGVYFVDTVNQVTKNTKGDFSLFNKKNYFALSKKLDKREKVLLKKYFNIKLIQNWALNLNCGSSGQILRNNLFFERNLYKYLKFYIVSFFPSYITTRIITRKSKLNSNSYY